MPRGDAKFDEIRSTMIAINKIIPDPRQKRYVQYRLTLKDGDPAQIFPSGKERQSIQPGPDKNSLVMNVFAAGPGDGTAGPLEVDATYLRRSAQSCRVGWTQPVAGRNGVGAAVRDHSQEQNYFV